MDSQNVFFHHNWNVLSDWDQRIQDQSYVQVNLFQKLLFLHQLTHNMTKGCSLYYKFRTWKLQAQNMLCTWIVLNVKTKNNLCTQHVLSLQFLYSMNNLSSYCGLVDAKIRAFDKDTCITLLLRSKGRSFKLTKKYHPWFEISFWGWVMILALKNLESQHLASIFRSAKAV